MIERRRRHREQRPQGEHDLLSVRPEGATRPEPAAMTEGVVRGSAAGAGRFALPHPVEAELSVRRARRLPRGQGDAEREPRDRRVTSEAADARSRIEVRARDAAALTRR
jgi:hypothetical protein